MAQVRPAAPPKEDFAGRIDLGSLRLTEAVFQPLRPTLYSPYDDQVAGVGHLGQFLGLKVRDHEVIFLRVGRGDSELFVPELVEDEQLPLGSDRETRCAYRYR